MSYSLRPPRTFTVFLLVACLIPIFAPATEAKSKKKGRAVARAKGKASKQARVSKPGRAAKQTRTGKRTSSRFARRTHRSRQRHVETASQESPAPNVVPDRIEVLEHNAANSADLVRWLKMPAPRASLSSAFADIEAVASMRRRSVNIDSERVLQIQQALANRGFYAGEMTGVYDSATVDAMRRFQANTGISVTGYPTAHALKRLELGNW
jgi:hypothetical protein